VSRKYLFATLKILIFLVVCGWVGWRLYESWDKIQEIPWTPNYSLLVLAGICYAVAFIPAAVFWRYAMLTLGQKPGVYEAFRAYYIGHLGKYVPGKVMVLVIRTGLVQSERTKITAAGASVFVETMTMMAVGAFIAALIAAVWFRQTEHGNLPWLLALGVMVGTMLPILPPVFHFATKRLKKFQIELEGLRFRTLAFGWLFNIPLWIMLGFSLWLTMLGFGMKSESVIAELPTCILAVSLSIVAGFASMLPAGLGSREAVMIFVLIATPPIGLLESAGGVAIVVVTVHRIISLLSELTVSAILAWKPKPHN
jgi:uncharacterized membrane protein YbhN (UPF0104 family)